MMYLKVIFGILIIFSTQSCKKDLETNHTSGNDKSLSPPNIILIMVDDMGWSDVGCYGGEIPTPHIDSLAAGGIRFTHFYNNARCCPTRASLMTGLYAHQTGIGQMTETPRPDDNSDWGTPGYQGYLNQNSVTIAEVLGSQGYNTYMTGKWHLGYHGKDKWPLQRGFDKYYGTLAGASSYFKPQGDRGITENNEPIKDIEQEGYYTTDEYTNKAIEYIEGNGEEKPFFLYLAYNAPHWPLQAKEEDIALFKEKYLIGWDSIRQARFSRQKEMGLINKNWKLSPRDERVRAWENLSPQEQEDVAYRMAVYAAQVYAVDYNIGKLRDYLKSKDLDKNTVIMFLSDNGACAEMYDELGSKSAGKINDPDFSGAVSYGIGWANASNTPFFEYKVKSYEGGIATPFIFNYSPLTSKKGGDIVNTRSSIRDVMPAILDITGTSYPETFKGNEIYRLEGRSFLPAVENGEQPDQEYLFWEHQNIGAVQKDDWKLVIHLADNTKELYHILDDRTETNDLSEHYPEVVDQLFTKWENWATKHYVFPKRL